ncbi:MAG: hypothetical protein ACFCU5_07785 [Pleurocapsa sp.]
MNYYYNRLPNGRWGIYEQGKLLATIGCYQTCQEILKLLAERKIGNSNKTKDLRSPQVDTKKLVGVSNSNVSKNQTAA